MCLNKFFKEKKARQEILKMNDIILDNNVIIQGTQYDRKRKLTDKQIKNIKNDLSRNMSIEEVSIKYKVSKWVIRYNTDPSFRDHQLKIRMGKHTGTDKITFKDRVNYKRSLIKDRKIKAVGII